MKIYPSKFLTGRSFHATDGEIGRCKDFLFDAEQWTIRYIVIDTRKWLPGRQVVISPTEVDAQQLLDREGQIRLRISRDDIRESPSLEEHSPVSRRIERELTSFWGWPEYWDGLGTWGASAALPDIQPRRGAALKKKMGTDDLETRVESEVEAAESSATNGHLHSAREIATYVVETPEGNAGHLADFAFETEAWKIALAVLATRDWFPGATLALPIEWIHQINVFTRTVELNKSREVIQRCPKVDSSAALSEEQFKALVEKMPG